MTKEENDRLKSLWEKTITELIELGSEKVEELDREAAVLIK